MRQALLCLAILAISNAPSFAQMDASKWTSASECYQSYVRESEGSYPAPGDDTNELVQHCKRAVERALCNFRCSVTLTNWTFATSAPASQREARLKAFFRESAR
jgi:hypothetical protein